MMTVMMMISRSVIIVSVIIIKFFLVVVSITLCFPSYLYSIVYDQIGDRSDSTVYIKSKVKAAEEVRELDFIFKLIKHYPKLHLITKVGKRVTR